LCRKSGDRTGDGKGDSPLHAVGDSAFRDSERTRQRGGSPSGEREDASEISLFLHAAYFLLYYLYMKHIYKTHLIKAILLLLSLVALTYLHFFLLVSGSVPWLLGLLFLATVVSLVLIIFTPHKKIAAAALLIALSINIGINQIEFPVCEQFSKHNQEFGCDCTGLQKVYLFGSQCLGVKSACYISTHDAEKATTPIDCKKMDDLMIQKKLYRQPSKLQSETVFQ
jgi:hypothetical protein